MRISNKTITFARRENLIGKFMDQITYRKKNRDELVTAFKESLRKKKEWLSENNLRQVSLGEIANAM